ncbi:hypothetical protein DO021_08645 [Desulfobacter hydrogenophilus]|uniref:Uncharacterized protein n=2 Tax=Desulfobacter hydrogenophilus TaxID=2291 RepID=A0A328FH87_9BACT|nr:hypothetical protein DO021_08645 [Desulfobacter hydrogenophilus]
MFPQRKDKSYCKHNERRKKLENNFTMKTHKQDKDLHIDMKGTFDGASAFALIHELGNKIYDKNNSIYVETKDISKVYPFGRAILASNLPKACRKCVYFSGAMADRIAPEGCARGNGNLHQGCHKCTGNCENCPCKKSSTLNSQTERISAYKK